MSRARSSKWNESYDKYINGGQYIYTSHAPELAPYEPSRPKRDKPGRAGISEPLKGYPPVKVKRIKPGQSACSIEIDNEKKRKLLRNVTLAAIVLCAFLCVYSMAHIESKRLELASLQGQLQKLKTNNIILQGEILDNYDLSEVERYAIGVLGMVKPQESQIIYVEEVKVSYVETYDAVSEDVNPLDMLMDVWSSLKSLVYTEKPASSGF